MIQKLLGELNEQKVILVAVTKTRSVNQIMNLYDLGIRDFGENRVQELVDKYELLPKDIRWHMIGHLQSKKLKHIAPFVHMIHSVDRLSLLELINKQADKLGKKINILLQFKIAQEASKYGFDPQLFESMDFDRSAFQHVEFSGVMGMASFTSDQDQVRREFQHLNKIFQNLKTKHFSDDPFQEISMGMSGDYHTAIAEGSTMVRIGSLLFQ